MLASRSALKPEGTVSKLSLAKATHSLSNTKQNPWKCMEKEPLSVSIFGIRLSRQAMVHKTANQRVGNLTVLLKSVIKEETS